MTNIVFYWLSNQIVWASIIISQTPWISLIFPEYSLNGILRALNYVCAVNHIDPMLRYGVIEGRTNKPTILYSFTYYTY